ncbi:serine hydrolase [Microbispora sp. H13382]|uniref:serine hydrolase domain-containing protein n=1 Tax=Microbispora sp. H13382 TaxID=2729112 RepID=UPI001600941B|nr:serine hydrolase domain-containing protein [Microbispora sp. H13382]
MTDHTTDHTTDRVRSRRWIHLSAAVLALTYGLAAPQGTAHAENTADAENTARAGDTVKAGDTARPDDTVQASLDTLVRSDGFPAALASVRGRDGRVRDYTAGVADLRTRAKVPVDGYVRIGSNTKTFTAVVVLQLAGEGRVKLDEPIETYLPGLIRGRGNDGRRITVRRLLQHTSGLPDYTAFLVKDPLSHRNTYMQPRELLDLALKEKAHFTPGAKWEYSNTNYLVAGLLIERVTRRPLAEQIDQRIVKRLGLRHTYLPDAGDRRVRAPHPKGYHRDDRDEPFTDVTAWDPSQAWSAGGMISTPRDVNRFFRAVLGGELLEPDQLREMRTTVRADGLGNGARYGLGLVSTPLSCGGLAWGHGGDIFGFHTSNAVTEDGRAAAVAVTLLPGSLQALGHVDKAVDAALCS